MAVNMKINFAGVEMKNPVTVASGTFGQGREYSQFFKLSELGAVTTKGVSAVPWDGNPGVRIAETPSGMLNSIGLQNKGVQNMIENELPWLETQDATVIVNIAGHSVAEYCDAIQALEDSSAKFEAYEVNISCPNVDKGGLAFGQDPKVAADVISHVKEISTRPVIAKLSPNVTDITQIALAVQEAGADAVSMINTILGMAINAEEQRADLTRIVGGLRGPAVKPVALRMVWQCYQVLDIPILGMGGITTASDAVEFMLAGASAVAVGTANFIDPKSTIKVIEGLKDYCKRHGITNISDLTGALKN